MLDKMTSENFKDIVGTRAILTVMDGPDVELRVEKVLELAPDKAGDRPDSCRKKPFTLILSGAESHQAPDGCYDLSFEQIGVLEGVYIDNKSDNPETGQFNTQRAQEATEEATDAAFSTEPGPRVLYEINFG